MSISASKLLLMKLTQSKDKQSKLGGCLVGAHSMIICHINSCSESSTQKKTDSGANYTNITGLIFFSSAEFSIHGDSIISLYKIMRNIHLLAITWFFPLYLCVHFCKRKLMFTKYFIKNLGALVWVYQNSLKTILVFV